MGVVSTIVAVAAVASAVGTYRSYQEQRKASKAQRRAAQEQREINRQQEARNAQQSTMERRQQLREERIRRARILQSAENMGVGSSSGAMGAVGGLSTNLSSNLGANLGSLRSARTISRHSQNQADFMSAANQHMANANMWGQLSSFSSSIFSAGGGFGAFNGGSVTDVSGTPHRGVNWGFSASL